MATYYFSPSGNDITGDGSLGNPWKDPSYTLHADLPADGDTFSFIAGTYSLSNSIAPNGDCTFTGAGMNDTIIIGDGNEVPIDCGIMATGVGKTVTVQNLGLITQSQILTAVVNGPIQSAAADSTIAALSLSNVYILGVNDIFHSLSTTPTNYGTISLTDCVLDSYWDIFAELFTVVTASGCIFKSQPSPFFPTMARCFATAGAGSAFTNCKFVAISFGDLPAIGIGGSGIRAGYPLAGSNTNNSNTTFTNCIIEAYQAGTGGVASGGVHSIAIQDGTFTMVNCTWDATTQSVTGTGAIVGTSIGGGGGIPDGATNVPSLINVHSSSGIDGATHVPSLIGVW